ncbi:hypothetical protein IFM89_035962 [Coptis chinensis]|uniref:Uncharacterized protein n=1 Tax=Coptis chinensis TaxID=261450 RepID=A0A835H1L9_9MAGN|nr:hypothetical protein IFM89_035962 [Coptis chinensis]
MKASPITFGDLQVYIEEKRTSTRVGATGRPRYPPARPGFRNDNFRGRCNFVGGRGYGRNEYGNRGDFSGRRSQSRRGGDGYQ